MAAATTIRPGLIGAIQQTVGQAHDTHVGIIPYLDAARWGRLLAVTLLGIGVMLTWRVRAGSRVATELDAAGFGGV